MNSLNKLYELVCNRDAGCILCELGTEFLYVIYMDAPGVK
jgi:hypothetical protein